MKIRRGDVWIAELEEPRGSEPGYRRPVVVVQSDYFNRSSSTTVLVAVTTTNMRRAHVPGNVTVTPDESGLEHDSVVNVTQILAVDRLWFDRRVGRLPASTMRLLDEGLSLVLGLSD